MNCGDYSVLTVGKTIIEAQYLRDSIIGSATGNSREYAVRLCTVGLAAGKHIICIVWGYAMNQGLTTFTWF